MRANQPLTCGFVAWDADGVGSHLRPSAIQAHPNRALEQWASMGHNRPQRAPLQRGRVADLLDRQHIGIQRDAAIDAMLSVPSAPHEPS